MLPEPPRQPVIRQPLARVLGSRLIAVRYYVLSDDAPGFALDQPNRSGGCQGVRLEFAAGELELDWDFRDPAFRDAGTTYYLAVRSQSEREAPVQADPASDAAVVLRLDAAPSRHWRRLLGERLLSATRWGWELLHGNGSPQAATLTFPSGEVTAAIGMSGVDGSSVGDGDEVLLFDGPEWLAQSTPGLIPIWVGSSRT